MSDLAKRVKLQLVKLGKKRVDIAELRKATRVSKSEKAEFEKIVRELMSSGVMTRRGKGAAARKNAKKAVIVKVKGKFGFARVEGEDKDVFVPGKLLLGTMPGDKVMLKVTPTSRELDEGEVISVISRADTRLSGTVAKDDYDREVFVADSGDYFPIQITHGKTKAEVGDKVTVFIKQEGESHRDCRAIIERVFGSSELAKNCCSAILEAMGISKSFPKEVLNDARQRAALLLGEEIEKRLDLRGEPVFTIDGADTKDIDDAVSVKKTKDGWQLGVHIADVSFYVLPHSALDNEAYKRGTSVYFADSVVPMLPPALSNGACSLNPNEDRLAFSAIIKLDNSGAIKEYQFAKTVIRSRVKGVYAEINRLLDGDRDKGLTEKYSEVMDEIPLLEELAGLLKKRRFSRGSLALSSVESKIKVDENGVAEDILPRVSGASENIIEELMLTANEAAASLAVQKELPFLFRVHENPSPEKLALLKELLDAVGINSKGVHAGATPAELSAVLSAALKTQYGVVINSAMLRTMQKARYSENNLGHFGLALGNYAHFTSPIRRYPDLAIHRILSDFLSGAPNAKLHKRYDTFAASASKQSSAMEQNAVSVERMCEDRYKAEYMRRHLGERFTGVITSTAAHGIYVMLENTVEGLIRAEDLGENMLFDGRMQYLSRDGKRRFRIGDRVEILVAAADVSMGRIDFVLA